MLGRIERDLKAALLGGDKKKTEVLRGIKNALNYEAVNSRTELPDISSETVNKVLSRESKKRHEAAEIYKKAGETERMQAELEEKAVIDAYLPEQLSEEEVAQTVDEELAKIENPGIQDMGRLIGAVRGRLQGQADGAMIAKLVKQKLQ